MVHLYNCKHATDAYRITKFTGDLEVESSYLCTISTCECPAGHRPKCRHREMLPKFTQRGVVDSHWFFDYDRGGWVEMQQVTEREVYGEGSNKPIDIVLRPKQEPSQDQVEKAIGVILGGFPDWCISSGECTTPNDCILHGCVHGHGNPPRVLAPAGLGQVSDPQPSPNLPSNEEDQGEDFFGESRPSPSPTIRRRV